MNSKTRDELWGVVLAAGEGSRLAPLTRRLYGAPIPKQFARLVGERSLLQDTLERIGTVIPARRTVVVVPAGLEATAREQVSLFPGVHVIPQPQNRGTGPGILLPLAYVLASAPDARVAVVPSDHYVPNPAPLLDAVLRSAALVDDFPLALLGVAPEAPETEYGWIRLGAAQAAALRVVKGFVEKPSPDVARALFRAGALWNTFVMTARGRSLWDLTERRLPTQASQIRAAVTASGSAMAMRATYEVMRDANFSQVVLAATAGLTAAAVKDSGWCDWGTPDRVLASLEGTPHLLPLLERLESARRPQRRRMAPKPNVVPVGAAAGLS